MNHLRVRFSLPLLAKELTELACRRRTYTVRVLFTLFLAGIWLLLVAEYASRPRSNSRLAVLGHGADVLDALFVYEWCALCLILPVSVSGTIVSEKERNTLPLLFVSRLGPWTILFEKLLSRMVPIGALLLASLPLLTVTYALGGVERRDLLGAIASLVATVIEVSSIALFCSAYSCTSGGSLLMSYVLQVAVFLGPFVGVTIFEYMAGLVTKVTPFARPRLPSDAADAFANIFSAIDLQMFARGPFGLRPYRPDLSLVWGPLGASIVFLLLARWALVRRATAQPSQHVRRVFHGLDRTFRAINDRFAGGLMLIRDDGDLPADHPVAWREARRGNLGRWNYLLRIVVAMQVPLWVHVASQAIAKPLGQHPELAVWKIVFWLLAMIVVGVRSAGLIAAERTRRTLDVLLATPLSLRAIVGEKLAAVRRLMIVMSIPIVAVTWFRIWWNGHLVIRLLPPSFSAHWDASARPPAPMLIYLACLLLEVCVHLLVVSRLGFLVGLKAKTQGRAVAATLAILAGWMLLPLLFPALVQVLGKLLLSVPVERPVWLVMMSPFVLAIINETGGNPLFRGEPSPERIVAMHFASCVLAYLFLGWAIRNAAASALVRPREASSDLRQIRAGRFGRWKLRLPGKKVLEDSAFGG
jgi:ABC-type transport system involved in multi-copper enzyme maturation permease subunit